jgi:hypothetical protein
MIRKTLAKVNRFLCVTMLWIIIVPQGLIQLGGGMNQLVILANHDMFPVLINPAKAAHTLPNGIDSDGHILMSKDTHLNVLGDIFDFHDKWSSLGDLTIELGTWMSTWAPFMWVVLVSQRLLKQASSNNET